MSVPIQGLYSRVSRMPRTILLVTRSGDESKETDDAHAAPATSPTSQRSQWPQAGVSASSSLK